MKKLDLFVFRGRPKKISPLFPSMYCMDYLSSDLMLKQYGFKSKPVYIVCNQEDYFSALDAGDLRALGKKLLMMYLAHPSKLDNLIKWSNLRKNSLRDFIINNLPAKGIKNLSNIEIVKCYLNYVKLYRNFHLINTPSWWIGSEATQQELTKLLKNKNISNVDELIGILAEPLEYASENFEEEISLLKICQKIKDARVQRIKTILDLPASIRKELKRHISEFSSIPFAYNTGIVWDDKYFIKEINKILSNKAIPKEIIEKKLESIENKIRERERLIKKYKLSPRIIELSKILRKLVYLQDIKKATQTKSHPHLQLVVLAEIARRLMISVFDLGYMTHLEISKSLKVGKVDLKLRDELIERQKKCVLSISDLKYSWLVGSEADEFLKVNGFELEKYQGVKEIKGSIGCKGYAKGIVKVCKSSTEIVKVKSGDVLVTAMTTPDFVPAMKRAVATITDEGGVTCHAAIVARELNKPCIIGTKIATKVLKDGDMVEVDADKGIVKIINHAK